MLVMAQPDGYWPAFCRGLGHPEWQNQPEYDSLSSRMQNSARFTRLLDDTFATADRETWARRLDAEGLIWAPVQELPEVMEDPTIRELGSFSTIEHPVIGSFETVSIPFHIKGADIAVRGPAPDPGEHTTEILDALGFDSDEIAEFAAGGAFG